MPAGDAQRVWFPEMIEELKTYWSPTVPWNELADFCARMTEMRKRISQERGLKPPKMRCNGCGGTLRPLFEVSIRSALFALKKNGVITDTELEDLDKSWARHKRAHGLDAFGRKAKRR